MDGMTDRTHNNAIVQGVIDEEGIACIGNLMDGQQTRTIM